MDVSDASYYIQENTKIKVAKWGTPNKKNKKKHLKSDCPKIRLSAYKRILKHLFNL
jgi:hypothetical protein